MSEGGRKGNTYRTCYVCHNKQHKCTCHRDPTLKIARNIDDSEGIDYGVGINKHRRWEEVEEIMTEGEFYVRKSTHRVSPIDIVTATPDPRSGDVTVRVESETERDANQGPGNGTTKKERKAYRRARQQNFSGQRSEHGKSPKPDSTLQREMIVTHRDESSSESSDEDTSSDSDVDLSRLLLITHSSANKPITDYDGLMAPEAQTSASSTWHNKMKRAKVKCARTANRSRMARGDIEGAEDMRSHQDGYLSG